MLLKGFSFCTYREESELVKERTVVAIVILESPSRSKTGKEAQAESRKNMHFVESDKRSFEQYNSLDAAN